MAGLSAEHVPQLVELAKRELDQLGLAPDPQQRGEYHYPSIIQAADGTLALVLEPLEFLQRSAAMTPRPEPTCSFAMACWPRAV